MREEDFIDEQEIIEEEYTEEELEELEPEMQGWIQGWKKAGRYNKKEKPVSDFNEEY